MAIQGGSYDIAVIGGGQAAKSILMRLAEKVIARRGSGRQLRVAVFERGQEIGPGSAWSSTQNLPEHLASQPGGAPRIQYGREQIRVIDQLVEVLRTVNVSVDLFKGVEIVGLQCVGGGWLVQADQACWQADAVVLATGHWRNIPPELEDIAHEYPWPASELQEVVRGGRSGLEVGILGSYHTAIDTALTIALAAGRFEPDGDGKLRYIAARPFKTTLLSRSGRLPLVWPHQLPKIEPAQLLEQLPGASVSGELGFEKFIETISRVVSGRTENGGANVVSSLRRMLDRLYLQDHAATLERCLEPRSWTQRNLRRMAAVAALLPAISELFPYLDAESYQRFQNECRSAFFNVAMPMARVTADRIRALLQSGNLGIERLGQRHFGMSGGKPVLRRRAADVEEARTFDVVVNGLASCGPISNHPGRLIRSLLSNDIIVPAFRPYALNDHRHGREQLAVPGVQINHRSCEVMPGASMAVAPSGYRLYTMGPINSGLFLDAQSIGQLARDSERIVSHLAA